jgi:hypothetical protein
MQTKMFQEHFDERPIFGPRTRAYPIRAVASVTLLGRSGTAAGSSEFE